MFSVVLPTGAKTVLPNLNMVRSVERAVIKRFTAEASPLILASIRSVLGTTEIYELSPTYAARKPTMKGFRRIAGKASTQPLIFSGDMYDALVVVPGNNNFYVEIDRSRINNHNPNYVEIWEERTQFVDKGIELVEDKLEELLMNIVFDELGL